MTAWFRRIVVLVVGWFKRRDRTGGAAQTLAADALDRPRSRSELLLGIPQAAEAGREAAAVPVAGDDPWKSADPSRGEDAARASHEWQKGPHIDSLPVEKGPPPAAPEMPAPHAGPPAVRRTISKKRKRHDTAAAPPPAPEAKPEAPAEAPEVEAIAPGRELEFEAMPAGNRHARRQIDAMRRKLERARMKHDVWVKPAGPEPTHYPRATQPEKPEREVEAAVETAAEADDFVDPNERVIADEWVHGDGGGNVLFEMSEFYGTYNFRDTILTQLDRYWVYIERMKRADPDAYGFYKRLGATLIPYSASGANWEKGKREKFTEAERKKFLSEIRMTPWFKKTWPCFGCVAWGTNPLHEAEERADKGWVWIPKFLYFVRIDPEPWPWDIEHPAGAGKLYILTMWWDRPDHPKGMKGGVPQEFPVWISDDGETVRALKTRKRGDGSYRPPNDWRIPHHFQEWAKQYGLTARQHLAHLFCDAARDIEHTYYSMCRVAVTKGDLTAVFGIEPQRCAYFFKDRDITLDRFGRKQRIFHAVRPHVRADGTAVPMQFRGLKEFTWAGYEVSITVPGRDHFLLPEFDVPLKMTKNRNWSRKLYRSAPQIGAILKGHIKAGLGAWRGYAQ